MDRFSFRDLRDCKNAHFTNRLRLRDSVYYTDRRNLWKFELSWIQALSSVIPKDRYYDIAYYAIVEAKLHLILGNLKEASGMLFYGVNTLSFVTKVPCRTVIDIARDVLEFLPPEDNQVTWDTYKWILSNFTGNKEQLAPQSKNGFAISLFESKSTRISRQLSKSVS